MKQILVSVIMFLSAQGFAQDPHAILSSLNAYKQPNGVLVRWTIKGGSQCNGTKVFRSASENPFELVNFIPGICGSTTASESYQFFDSSPVSNATNSYKLEMGDQGFTDTITVFFEDFGRANHVLLSDYQSQSYRILFSNDLNSKAVLQVFDRMGSAIHSETTTNNYFIIKSSGWTAGVYLFRVSGVSDKDIQGKLYFGGQ